MKVRPPRVLNPVVVSRIADHLRQGVTLEYAISEMRTLGLNKIESMKLLRDYAGIPLGEAKDLVHLSPSWADRYESDERASTTSLKKLSTSTPNKPFPVSDPQNSGCPTSRF